jgi:hypothetical protein
MAGDTIWYQYDLSNEKQFIKCIKALEFIIRKSLSYAIWQKRSKYLIDKCPACGETFEYVPPESHHHPLTLFDIVENTLQKHIDLNDLSEYKDFDICEEVMDLHFQKKIDYIVICKHCHEKYHNGDPNLLDVMDELTIKQNEERRKIGT